MTDNQRPDPTRPEPARHRAVTVGSATVDIITVIADRDIERVTMTNVTASFLLLEEGRKIEAESITIHPGGGALNSAVCLARLGYATAPIVKLGTDLNAAKILETFDAEGLARDLVRQSESLDTGITVMVSSHDRNASIFTFRGANTLISREDVPEDAFLGAGLVHVSGLSNTSADQHGHVVGAARRAGAFVSNNPGIRQLTSRREAFFAALADIDLISINRVEAEALMPGLAARLPDEAAPHIPDDAPELMRRGLDGSGFDMSLEGFCAAVGSMGPRYVAVTDGTRGAYLWARGALYFCPPLRVDVAGTAGAGDAFAATLAAALVHDEGPDRALAAATANAASVVGHIDTQTGLLTRTELGDYVAETGEALNVRQLL